MKPVKYLVLLAIAAITIVSCTKKYAPEDAPTKAGGGVTDTTGNGGGDNGGNNPSAAKVEGTWKFAGIAADTYVLEWMDDGTEVDSSITLSSYTSTDNVGTVVMKDGKFSNNGVGYSISCDLIGIFWSSLDPQRDTASLPFSFALPPTSSSGTYKLIGTDSMVTQGSLAGGVPTGQGAPTPTTTGGKLSFSGDTLFITSSVAISKSGVYETAKVVTKLVK